jgi:predicted house-cleaning noncanonical NTP pyrophosphatase (MazG superfamily)
MIIYYDKLIRDNIPSIIEKEGKLHNTIVLDQESFLIELRKKLIEEANELNAALSKSDILNELADIEEIIETLMREYDISYAELQSKKLDKKLKNGGFDKKLFLISVTEAGDKLGE